MNSIQIRSRQRAARAVVVVALTGAALVSGCKGSGDNASSSSNANASPDASTTVASSGEEIFARCAVCHQPTGVGVPSLYPPLAGSEIATGDPAIPIRILLHGLQGPLTVKGEQFNNVMLPGGGVPMSDQEIASVLTYVRSSFGNSAAPVTASEVASVRAETASRTEAWTAPELEQVGK